MPHLTLKGNTKCQNKTHNPQNQEVTILTHPYNRQAAVAPSMEIYCRVTVRTFKLLLKCFLNTDVSSTFYHSAGMPEKNTVTAFVWKREVCIYLSNSNSNKKKACFGMTAYNTTLPKHVYIKCTSTININK